MIVFATRYTSVNIPATRVVVMSPMATGTASAPGLGSQPGGHGGRQFDPRHGYPTLTEGERHSSGADREFERWPITGQLGQEVDHRPDRGLIELRRVDRVVDLGDVFIPRDRAHRTSLTQGRPATQWVLAA